MTKIKIDDRRKASQITPFDLEIFKKGRTNANWITDHYFRSPASGTYWRRMQSPPNPQREAVWRMMYAQWKEDGQPKEIWVYREITYKVIWDEDGAPVFWHHHGWLFQPWQLRAHHAPQKDVTLIAGMGVGKTAYLAVSHAVLSMTIPNYRGYAVAPQMVQAQEVYLYIVNNFADTPFYERFVTKAPLTPNPSIEVRNSYVRKSTISFMAIENDIEKVRTVEVDRITLDQAEKLDDLVEVGISLGSRLRGQVQGRQKLGRLDYVANSGDNPELWMRYDMADSDPEHYYSDSPKTWDNIYLSQEEIDTMKRRISPTGNVDDINQYMGGERPLGKGEHFPAHQVREAHWPELDKIMDRQIAKERGMLDEDLSKLELSNTTGWVRNRNSESGVYKWEAPPDFKFHREYITVADPGQGNPPGRNSPVIMTWDVTDFPNAPMVMRAFSWVYGDGSYGPFLQEYMRHVRTYRTQSKNAFDSTGTQTGFDELFFSVNHLYAKGLSMSGNGKYYALNAAKFFLTNKLVRYPSIPHLMSQLTNYRLPDEKIRQDLVSCFAMSCLFAKQFFFMDIPSDDPAVRENNIADLPKHRTRNARITSNRSNGRGRKRA